MHCLSTSHRNEVYSYSWLVCLQAFCPTGVRGKTDCAVFPHSVFFSRTSSPVFLQDNRCTRHLSIRKLECPKPGCLCLKGPGGKDI